MADNMLQAITPVILTYNEGHNIARTLSALGWAKEIVVVDSGSTDETMAILKADPRIRLYTRKFDSHYGQWHFATQETDITTAWILRLDADYYVTSALVEEMSKLDANGPENAYRISFDYAIFSKKLLASLYPSNTILLRRGAFTVADAGHTESWSVTGPVDVLRSRVVHDDWKPMSPWVLAQANYMARELKVDKHRGLRDWLRHHPPLMPIAVFFYCLFFKGLIFDGRKGIFYTLQRTIAESVYALFYLEKLLSKEASPPDARTR
jgi:glycosyltransferase involved in cell wall biosynthesis